jgi:hypothetical protein
MCVPFKFEEQLRFGHVLQMLAHVSLCSIMFFILHGTKATSCVATLALGSQPRQRGYKGAGQEEAWESRQRGCKGAGQKEAWESRQHTPRNVRKCEGV